MTGERRYFRVIEPLQPVQPDEERPERCTTAVNDDAEDDNLRPANQFLAHVRAQREEHANIVASAANVNPDPTVNGCGSELWMRKLGLDRYVAGLRKDEMVASYEVRDDEDPIELRDLREISERVLRET